MSDLVGTTLGRYHVVARIGSGAMAHVYRAYQPALDRYVAIKVLRVSLADREDFVRRFAHEGAALARLRHPNIVQVHDFDSEGDLYYLVMELIEGPTLEATLRERLVSGQRFAPAEIVPVFAALADAVDHAHAHGMIHRDIKPTNIMFTAEGQVVLTDFGIARIVGTPGSTLTGSIGGTPDYMSPEQCQGAHVDARCDIYALGATLYQWLTGRVPFVADSPVGVIIKHISEPVLVPSALNPDIPPALDQVILRALNKEPEQRYQTAGEMAVALGRAVRGTGPYEPAPIAARAGPDAAILSRTLGPAIAADTPPQDRLPVEQMAAPFQAPGDILRFVGRSQALADLYAALADRTGQTVYCITGMGGIGKTSLAIHIAHALRGAFPDGVLWGNAATSEPLAILDSWARAYDCDFSNLPDVESRAAALRGVLAGKQVLVILDDVWSADRVRPLLPGGSHSAALLTTRDLELAVSLGVGIYPLSALTGDESRELMERILGPERVAAERTCADEICHLLGHLPLAVEIASQRLASRRRWTLSDLAERLRGENRRLHELRIRDREVRASIALSWEGLDSALRRSFALLAVFGARSFSLSAFAAVAELDSKTAEDCIYALVGLSLASEDGEARFRQHPLLTDFSAECLGDDPPARQRMAQYYLHYATDHGQDYAGLEQEWDNLLAALETTFRQQMWPEVNGYADALTDAWFACGRFSDARQGYAWASQAARTSGDRSLLAVTLCRWGEACFEQSDHDEAERHLSQSLQIYDDLQDRRGTANARYHLGRIAYNRAQYADAQRLLRSALDIWVQVGDRQRPGSALYALAMIDLDHRRYPQAQQLGQEALQIQQVEDDRLGAMRTLTLLAEVARGQGDYRPAIERCQRALEIGSELQDRKEMAATRYTLCKVLRQSGSPQRALEEGRTSLRLLESIGNRRTQSQVLHQLSQIQMDLGDVDAALQSTRQSLQLCHELRDPWGAVYVLRHLGHLHHLLGHTDEARQAWTEALQTATQAGHPQADELLAMLAQLDAGRHGAGAEDAGKPLLPL